MRLMGLLHRGFITDSHRKSKKVRVSSFLIRDDFFRSKMGAVIDEPFI
jgi:hypothetical protein